MVYFRDYTSPSSKLKYLIIETEDGAAQTKLLVHTPIGQYASAWPSLRNSLHVANWTLENDHNSAGSGKTWSLQAPSHRHANIASALPSLGRRIIRGETYWGDKMITQGEYQHIPGYWEWTEDILSRSQQELNAAKIHDAVRASLFTYDRNSNILQSFFEGWCPKTNTLLTSVGEMSISLWDLHTLGGLPIAGSIYEETVPPTMELIGEDEKNVRFIPRACEHLFLAFHYLQEGKYDNPRVPLSKWINFWYKGTLRYRPAPPRREQKTGRLKSTHNPTGVISEAPEWSTENEAVFSQLGVKPSRVEETYLAAFLSCWLCTFVFPSEDGDFIRPGTFKVASTMACGRRTSLAVPVLASIYNNLNKISRLSRLDLIKVRFPIHYVYGWLAYHFKTHYALAKEPSVPLMVTYSGEGAAKYFNKEDARKRIHRGDVVAWTSTMLKSSQPHNYVDDNIVEELDSSYFMSIRFNYLPVRKGDSFIIEPYSPHRFGRQFGFYQNVPGFLTNDIRSASLEEGLRYFRICVSHKTMSQATFPPSTVNVKKFSSANYKNWWEKTHAKFLDENLQYLIDGVGPANTPLPKDRYQHPTNNRLPTSKANPAEQDKGRRPQLHQSVKNSTPLVGRERAHTLNKRLSPDGSRSSDGDRCWKRVKAPSEKLEQTNPHMVDIADSGSSSSKTLTTPIKESNGVGVMAVPQREKPQTSDESIARPVLRKSSSTAKAKQVVTSHSLDGSKDKCDTTSNKKPAAAASVFVGSKLVQNINQKYVSELWKGLQSKLSNFDLDLASSHEEDAKVVLAAMEGKGVDLTPIRDMLQSFFELATSFDQARSAFSDKVSESVKQDLLSKAGERLSLAMVEEEEKVEEVVSIRESIGKVKEKIEKLREKEKDLEALLEAAEYEVEEAKSKVLIAKEEYETCPDVASQSADDLANLERKKERLEASRQDLLSFKLSLD